MTGLFLKDIYLSNKKINLFLLFPLIFILSLGITYVSGDFIPAFIAFIIVCAFVVNMASEAEVKYKTLSYVKTLPVSSINIVFSKFLVSAFLFIILSLLNFLAVLICKKIGRIEENTISFLLIINGFIFLILMLYSILRITLDYNKSKFLLIFLSFFPNLFLRATDKLFPHALKNIKMFFINKSILFNISIGIFTTFIILSLAILYESKKVSLNKFLH